MAPGSHLLVLLPTAVVQLNPLWPLPHAPSQPVMLGDSRVVVADTHTHTHCAYDSLPSSPTQHSQNPKGKIIWTVDAAVLHSIQRQTDREREKSELGSSVALRSSAAPARALSLPVVPRKLTSAFLQHWH